MSILRRAILVGLLLPQAAGASVIVSEIAWMGTNTSANDEWLELFNDASTPVDVTGWKLSDGDKLSITLAGTIGNGEYAVLERTNDDSAPGTAFLIYSGALKNSGATLALRDVYGDVVDTVKGGANWSAIGGDNASKHTAQRTTSGWITAVATPGTGELVAIETSEVLEVSEAATSGFGFASSAQSTHKVVIDLPLVGPAAAKAAAGPTPTPFWPYIGLAGLLGMSIAGLWAGQRSNK